MARELTAQLALKADIRGLRSSLYQARREWKNFGRDINRVGRQMGTAMRYAGIATAAGLAATIKTGAQFQKAMSELSAITGATGKDLENLGRAARDMAKTSSFAAGEAATAFKLVASAKPDLLESAAALTQVTKNALTLAEAAGIDLPQAAESLGGALNQFSAGAEEAARFINVLAAGSKFGASSIADVAEALKNSGTVAASLGTSFEEANAAIQVLAASGIKAAEAGTGLRNVLLLLEKEGGNFSISAHGLTQALRNLAAEQLNVTELTRIFGVRNVVAANILTKNAEALATLTEKLTNTNVAFEQSAIQMDNLIGDLKLLKSATDEFLISAFAEGGLRNWSRSLVQNLTNFVSAAAPAGEHLGNIFRILARTIGELRDTLWLAVQAFVAFKLAAFASSVIAAVASLGAALIRTTVALRAMAAASVVNGVFSLARALKALTAASVLKNLGKFAAGLLAAGVALTLFAAGLDYFSKDQQGKGLVEKTFVAISDGVRDVVEEFGKFSLALPEFDKNLADSRAQATQDFKAIQTEIKKIADNVEQTGDAVSRETENMTSEMAQIWERAVERMQDAFAERIHRGLWEEGISGFKGFAGAILDIWKRTISEIVAAWATSGITNFLTAAGNASGVSGLFGGATGSGGGGGGIGSGLGSLVGSAIGNAFSGPIRAAISASAQAIGLGTLGSSTALAGGGAAFAAGSGFLGGAHAATAGVSTGAFGGLFNIAANAQLAGGGFGATLGAALPAIGAVVAGAFAIDTLTGGAIFGRAPKIRDSGLILRAYENQFALPDVQNPNYRRTGLFGNTFADIKRSGSLFGGGTKRWTEYARLPNELLDALRTAYSQVRISAQQTLGFLGIGADALDGFRARVRVSLKGLDEDAQQAAISQALAEIGEEMVKFGLTAHGLTIPIEDLSTSLQGLMDAAGLVQVAAERAALANAGRIDTLGILRQSFANLGNEQLTDLLRTARSEIRQPGRTAEARKAAQEVIQALEQELNTREIRAAQAGFVAKILERTDIVIAGINDLALAATVATQTAFEELSGAIESGGGRMVSATLALADQMREAALDYVDRVTSITGEPADTRLPGIPQFARGGIVPGAPGHPMLAVVHGGEEIIPYGERSGQAPVQVTINVQGDTDAMTLRALRNQAQEAAVIIADAMV